MASIKDQLETLDSLLLRHYPNLHAELRPGVKAKSWRSYELNEWFAWRNGQASESPEVLLWLYQFVGCDEGRHSLSILRRDLIAHPLNGLIILFLSTRLLYSVPLLIDHGGSGFYFDGIRNTVFHLEHGDRDRVFNGWLGFLAFLNELLNARPQRQNQMFQNFIYRQQDGYLELMHEVELETVPSIYHFDVAYDKITYLRSDGRTHEFSLDQQQ